MLTTPSGKPASRISSPKRSAESGVCSAGLSTIVQPAASAGASFQAAIISGKFHGMIWPDDADRLAHACRRASCPGEDTGMVSPTSRVAQPDM